MYKTLKVHPTDYLKLRAIAKKDNNRPLNGTFSIVMDFFCKEKLKDEKKEAKHDN